MYIKYKDILESDVTVDVRTTEEFFKMPLFEYNLPVIDKQAHDKLKKRIWLAIPVILSGFIKNRELLRDRLIDISCNRTKRVIIGCSQGRLRSPIIYLYARYLGISAKVLKGGIKPFFVKNSKTLKNLNGYLDI